METMNIVDNSNVNSEVDIVEFTNEEIEILVMALWLFLYDRHEKRTGTSENPSPEIMQEFTNELVGVIGYSRYLLSVYHDSALNGIASLVKSAMLINTRDFPIDS